jgi:asparagine synthase (glutamine-hydrolysing)
LRSWLQQDLREYVDDLLSENTLKNRGLFDPKAVKELVALDRCGKIDAAYPIFSLICIELWMRLFIDGRARRN